ncbi:MAG: hypothetical protein ABEK84_05420, partial [Salinibacter sp.]
LPRGALGFLVGSTLRSALPFLPLLWLMEGINVPLLAPYGIGLIVAVGITAALLYAYAPVFRDQPNPFLLHLTRVALVVGTSSLGLIVLLIVDAS